MTDKVLVSWSGGKDSALALHAYLRDHGQGIAALLTTVTEGYDRISMHGVRRSLLKSQAASLGYPLEEVVIPQQCTDETYGRLMSQTLEKYKALEVRRVVFGDLFLEDVRGYREERLARIGMEGIFPLWGTDTLALAHTFIRSGFRATIVCVDTEILDGDFAGREFDEQFLSDLPNQVDPCGENGEFHSFVYDGPVFSRRIEFLKGRKVLREGRFSYCDLLPVRGEAEEGMNAT